MEWRVHVHSIDSARREALSTFIVKACCLRSSLARFSSRLTSDWTNLLPHVLCYSTVYTCVRSSRAEVDKENKYQQLGNVEKWPGSRAWSAEPPGTTRVPFVEWNRKHVEMKQIEIPRSPSSETMQRGSLKFFCFFLFFLFFIRTH